MKRPSDDYSTFRLLHLLCRPVLPDDTLVRLKALNGPVHWATLLGKLNHYGGTSWFLGHAQTLDLLLPPAVLRQLQRGMRKEVARAMLTTATYEDLAPLLRTSRRDVLLLKGPAVEARAYPAHLMRPSNDLDLLVRPGRRTQVEIWLRNAGWTRVLGGGDGHADLWHGPGRRGAIDLHDAPLSPLRFRRLTTAAVHRQFDEATQLQDGTWTLNDVAHTALLLAHLHAGVFTDLRHLADLAQWLDAVRPAPAAVESALQRWGGGRCWRAAITALQRWDNPVLPAPWRDIQLAQTWRDITWRPLLHRAWLGSAQGRVEPPHWLRRAALLGHLDAPQTYAFERLRARCGRAAGAS
jgi:hypothetical protein